MVELYGKFNLVLAPLNVDKLVECLVKYNVLCTTNEGINVSISSVQDENGVSQLQTLIDFTEYNIESRLYELCKELSDLGCVTGVVRLFGIPFVDTFFNIEEYEDYLSSDYDNPNFAKTPKEIKELLEEVVAREAVSSNYGSFVKFVKKSNDLDKYMEILRNVYSLSNAQANEVANGVSHLYEDAIIRNSSNFSNNETKK